MKINPGDTVRVKTKNGDGVARVAGVDERSGTYRVRFDKITVDDGAREVTFDGRGLEGYVPGSAIRRE